MNERPAARPLHLPPEFRHAWVIFLVFGVVNLLGFWRSLRGLIAARPDLARGYRGYFLGVAAFLTLPWLIMGVGIEIGGLPNLFAFLSLRDLNPYVVAFHAALTAMLVLACYWVFLRRGAEFLVEHPGLIGRRSPKSTVGIRALWAFLLVFWFIVLVLRWKDMLPVPPLR